MNSCRHQPAPSGHRWCLSSPRCRGTEVRLVSESCAAWASLTASGLGSGVLLCLGVCAVACRVFLRSGSDFLEQAKMRKKVPPCQGPAPTALPTCVLTSPGSSGSLSLWTPRGCQEAAGWLRSALRRLGERRSWKLVGRRPCWRSSVRGRSRILGLLAFRGDAARHWASKPSLLAGPAHVPGLLLPSAPLLPWPLLFCPLAAFSSSPLSDAGRAGALSRRHPRVSGEKPTCGQPHPGECRRHGVGRRPEAGLPPTLPKASAEGPHTSPPHALAKGNVTCSEWLGLAARFLETPGARPPAL